MLTGNRKPVSVTRLLEIGSPKTKKPRTATSGTRKAAMVPASTTRARRRAIGRASPQALAAVVTIESAPATSVAIQVALLSARTVEGDRRKATTSATPTAAASA